jgi:hypothetical protein
MVDLSVTFITMEIGGSLISQGMRKIHQSGALRPESFIG